ncbi:hypothetical protein ABMC89_00870 [Sulfitobacter sp. HNIBRBA3233]|uniref:hypothetical protein n=1 Tax=Sulfitobacter marinivivus TaxID=3158558 RepID=UPI0032DE6F90
MKLFQTGPDRYHGATPPAADRYATINQRQLTFFVGLVALGLPTILIVGAFNPFLETCFRHSISHYYYAPFWGAPFIGALIFIGTYMLVYRGETAAEAKLSSLAGFFAFGVALFPTSGYGCDETAFVARAIVTFGPAPEALDLIKVPPRDGLPDLVAYFELTPWSATVHYTSAMLLFSFLAWFALVIFTAAEPHQINPDKSYTRNKQIRNSFYILCGSVMILCILAMGAYAVVAHLTTLDVGWWNANHMTFWCEAVALWAFGLSWMVKGRFGGVIFNDPVERAA